MGNSAVMDDWCLTVRPDRRPCICLSVCLSSGWSVLLSFYLEQGCEPHLDSQAAYNIQ